MRPRRTPITISLAILVSHVILVDAFANAPTSHPRDSTNSRWTRKNNDVIVCPVAYDVDVNEIDTDDPIFKIPQNATLDATTQPPPSNKKKKMELSWCNHDACYEAIREKVVGDRNSVELTGPATGQVVYSWEMDEKVDEEEQDATTMIPSPPAVLMLVKRDEDELLKLAAKTIEQLMEMGVQVLVDSMLMEELASFETINLDSNMIRLFYPRPVPGFGSGEQLFDSVTCNASTNNNSCGAVTGEGGNEGEEQIILPAGLADADLVVTLGGDGLLMHAAQTFSGAVPPILPVAGGSMGFLTPFSREEMLDAIIISLGLRENVVEDGILEDDNTDDDDANGGGLWISQRANNHMLIEPTSREGYSERPPMAFGVGNQICISMRMRLDCRIIKSDGSLLSRYAVLNEVVIDRGSSPYLASLECFCDDVHLTTVQADGIIFSTPTGSTAYSMAAGGSVVHPAVPAILVTPICPHVLSFRSMVFPDHVVLRCYVPSDARSTACVYFDGKHRTELNRGDSVQIHMSAHPVPTINRADHSSDWLSSLKRSFNFNTRVRPNPL